MHNIAIIILGAQKESSYWDDSFEFQQHMFGLRTMIFCICTPICKSKLMMSDLFECFYITILRIN